MSQDKILRYLREHPGAHKPLDIVHKARVSRSTIYRCLDKLVKYRFIVMIVTDDQTTYKAV